MALEGVSIGAALVTSYGLVAGSEAFGNRRVAFTVPWASLVLLVCGVVLASPLVALPSAFRVAKTPPLLLLCAPSKRGAPDPGPPW